jgi:hypothetical protein
MINLPPLNIDEGRDLDFSDTGISVQEVIGYRIGQIVVSAGYPCEVIEYAGKLHLQRRYPKRS